MTFLLILCHSVIGALIGKQEGRNIEVMNSFELLSHTIDDRVHIDKEYYYTKEEQCEYFVFNAPLTSCLYVSSEQQEQLPICTASTTYNGF